jgi:hypothetical protein
MFRVGGWGVGCSLVTALVTPLLLAGCGDEATCGEVQPCGGDLTGSWRFVSACANDQAVNLQLARSICSDATLHYESIKVEGASVYNADLSFSIEGTRSFSLRETVPLGCLTGPNDPTTCAELEQQTAQSMGVLSASCTGSDVCACRVEVSYTASITGTYMTSGTTLIDTTGGAAFPLEYCVRDNRLHFLELSTTVSMGPVGTATIVTDTVLERP